MTEPNDPRKKLIEDFVKRTELELGSFRPLIDRESKRTAVIVETREHPYLESVVKNVMFFLGQGWNLQIFHGKYNEKYVSKLFSDYGARLSLIPEITSLQDYDKLMTSLSFWRHVVGLKILVFQADSFLRKKGIDSFLEYDYVGSPWAKEFPWNLPDCAGGNGGISLRSKNKLIKALKTIPWDGMPEDIYFVHALRKLGSNVAPREVCLRFGVETVFSNDPLAIHSIESFLPKEQIEHLLKIEYK